MAFGLPGPPRFPKEGLVRQNRSLHFRGGLAYAPGRPYHPPTERGGEPAAGADRPADRLRRTPMGVVGIAKRVGTRGQTGGTMSHFRAWAIAAALSGVGNGPAIAANPPITAMDTRPWYQRLFVAPKPAGPVVRQGAVAAPPGQPPLSRPLSPEAIHAAFQAESEAFLRRLDVCVKLRQIALERHDDALLRQVDELERQAKALYDQRLAALGISKSVRAPLPATNKGSFAASLDLAPEKPTDPKENAARLVAPAAPVPVSGTAEVREVQP